MNSSSQQKTGANGGFVFSGRMAGKCVCGHIVCCRGRMSECLRWKRAHGIRAPRAGRARSAPIAATLAAFHSNNLMILSSRAYIDYFWGYLVHTASSHSTNDLNADTALATVAYRSLRSFIRWRNIVFASGISWSKVLLSISSYTCKIALPCCSMIVRNAPSTFLLAFSIFFIPYSL